MRLGIALPDGLPLTEAVEICVEAERLGYSDVWSYEVAGNDAFTPLAAIAARTERLRLGTAVVPASTRPPALLAMTSASLQSLSGGRFCLGLIGANHSAKICCDGSRFQGGAAIEEAARGFIQADGKIKFGQTR